MRPTGLGFGAYYNTDFLTPDAFEKVKYRQNVARTRASLAGKIDVNAGPNMNISFGASGAYSDRNGASWQSSVFNYDNLANYRDLDWRAYGKFTQRFQNVVEEGGAQGWSEKCIYTIMVDYSKIMDGWKM